MKLSFIVPVVHPELHLVKLIDSLMYSCVGLNDVELVIVNQSKSSVCELTNKICFPVREIITESIIPAAEARNLGAEHAKGEFLFFLDDDAVLVAENDEIKRLINNLSSDIDAGVTQRGEFINGQYTTHWPSENVLIHQRNFSKYSIEWNVIVRKNIFQQLGGFPDIGAGSRHAALSGEVFVLMAKLFGSGVNIKKINYIRIAHPALIKKENSALNLLGYFYGSGYSVGVSLKYFSMISSIYWLLRSISASVFDLIFRFRFYSNSTTPKLSKIGFALMYSRLVGLVNGINGNEIKEKSWLTFLIKKCH